jgi:hypothetical protein
MKAWSEREVLLALKMPLPVEDISPLRPWSALVCCTCRKAYKNKKRGIAAKMLFC